AVVHAAAAVTVVRHGADGSTDIRGDRGVVVGDRGGGELASRAPCVAGRSVGGAAGGLALAVSSRASVSESRDPRPDGGVLLGDQGVIPLRSAQGQHDNLASKRGVPRLRRFAPSLGMTSALAPATRFLLHRNRQRR